MQVYRDASIPYFKINAPFFCSPLVFEDLNPQVRINEMVSEYSVDYNPCPEGFILSCITTPLSSKFLLISLIKGILPIVAGKNFQLYV